MNWTEFKADCKYVTPTRADTDLCVIPFREGAGKWVCVCDKEACVKFEEVKNEQS